MNMTRRKYLTAAGGALLASSVLPTLTGNDRDGGGKDADVLYGHGSRLNQIANEGMGLGGFGGLIYSGSEK